MPLKKIPYISGNGTRHFSAQAQRIKKFTPRKLLKLQESKNPKRFILFFQKKASYIPENGNHEKKITPGNGTLRAQKMKKPTLKKLLIFPEIELFNPKLKKLLVFRRTP